MRLRRTTPGRVRVFLESTRALLLDSTQTESADLSAILGAAPTMVRVEGIDPGEVTLVLVYDNGGGLTCTDTVRMDAVRITFADAALFATEHLDVARWEGAFARTATVNDLRVVDGFEGADPSRIFVAVERIRADPADNHVNAKVEAAMTSDELATSERTELGPTGAVGSK